MANVVNCCENPAISNKILILNCGKLSSAWFKPSHGNIIRFDCKPEWTFKLQLIVSCKNPEN